MRHRMHHGVLVNVGLVELRDCAALAQDHDAIGALNNLLQLRGNHQDPEATISQLIDETLDLGLSANVDPACRFVEQLEPWIVA